MGSSFIVHDGREFQVWDGTLRRVLWALLWELDARAETAPSFATMRRRRLFARWLMESPPGVFLGDFDSVLATPDDRREIESLFRGAIARLDALGDSIPREEVDATLVRARMKPNWGALTGTEVRAALVELADILGLALARSVT